METDQCQAAENREGRSLTRPKFAAHLDEMQAFQLLLLNRLQATGQTAFYIDYEDILDLEVLNGLAAFLGVDGAAEALDDTLEKAKPGGVGRQGCQSRRDAAALPGSTGSTWPARPISNRAARPAVPQLRGQRRGRRCCSCRSSPGRSRRSGMAGGLWRADRPVLTQNAAPVETRHPGHRSFTVVRHPLARAHAAFARVSGKDGCRMRPDLKRVHKFDLPPKSARLCDRRGNRAGFLVFPGTDQACSVGPDRTANAPQLASQSAILQGFAAVQPPICHPRGSAGRRAGLSGAEVGLACRPCRTRPGTAPFPLARSMTPRPRGRRARHLSARL